MSRVGKKPIIIPSGVTVDFKNSIFSAKGPKGELTVDVDSEINVELVEGTVVVNRPSDTKTHRAMHGLYRALINNAILGVASGYELKLEFVGVGYKAVCANNILEMSLGYSHNIFFSLPSEVVATAVTDKGKNPIVTLQSIDKQLIGQVAAKIRSLRKVEPYKGKGVRFVGEQVRRKAGKTGAKK